MISTRLASSSLLFIIAPLFASLTWAAEYYVSPDGSDADPGTSVSTPWRTIAKANGQLRPGDVVHLLGGEYVNDPIRPARSGSSGAEIRYAAYRGEKPVLTSDKVAGLGVAVDLTDRSYIVVDGIHVDGVKRNPEARVGHFANLYRASYNTIVNCNFRYARGWHGIRISYEAHHNKLLNNVIDVVGIYDDGSGDDVGDVIQILRGSHHNLIQGNVITRGAHNLLQVDADNNVIIENTFDNDWSEIVGAGKGGRNLTLMGKQNLFERNIVRNAGRSSDAPSNAGMKTEGEGNIVRRNFIYGNSREGITSQTRRSQKVARDNHIFHNTIYFNGGAAWGLTFYDGGNGVTGNVFKNNIVYANRRDSGNGDVDFRFRLKANPDGVVGQSLIEGNLIAKQSSRDAMVEIESGGGVTSLEEAERQYAEFIKGNIQDSPTFVSSSPSKPEDFALMPGSRGVDEAAPLTRTRSAGSGKVVPLEDAGYFSDGLGVIAGDRIQIGGAPVRRVVDVDYADHTVTLTESAQWEAGAGVSLEYSGAGPDIGARELGGSDPAPLRRPKAPGRLSGIVR